MTAALQADEGEEARAYLNGRSLQPSERLGAFSLAIFSRLIQELQAKHTTIDAKAAYSFVSRFFPVIRKDFSRDAAGTFVNYADSYRLAIPYTTGTGKVVGFCLRKTNPQELTYKDENGETQTLPKYILSKGMPKGGYCETLKHTAPVLLVEGGLDAEALKQAGYSNVIALFGMTPTDSADDAAKSQIKTLQRYGAKQLLYIPDLEYKPDGTPKTDATRRTIEALRPYLTGKMEGTGFISLRIATLPNPTGEAKQDAQSVLQTQGRQALVDALKGAQLWYEWQLLQDIAEHDNSPEELAAAAVSTYCSIVNPIEQGNLRAALTQAKEGSPLAKLRAAGVTASALSIIDKNGAASTYRSRITEAIAELQGAASKNATAENIGRLLSAAMRIQNYNAAEGFAAQVHATKSQLHAQVVLKPDYLQTNWQLWKLNTSTQQMYECRKIGFSPANISVVAAPTSHGKTLFLIQTALHLVQKYCRHFLYISLENDAEQLYIRALAAYMGDKWAAGVANPRKEIRDFIKHGDMPVNLFTDTAQQRGFRLDREIKNYWQEVAPFLHFVRTGSGIDEICSNVAAQVEEWQNEGEAVGGIFIDYAQLLHATGRAYSRTDEMKGICDSLNDLAKATGLPIIIGSQLNRDATRNNGDKLDGVALANIGESSGIENIAEDCYLIWSTDRIEIRDYTAGDSFKIGKYQNRSRRIFTPQEDATNIAYTPEPQGLRRGCLYIESLKGREYETGCYCIVPANFATGSIPTDTDTQY